MLGYGCSASHALSDVGSPNSVVSNIPSPGSIVSDEQRSPSAHSHQRSTSAQYNSNLPSSSRDSLIGMSPITSLHRRTKWEPVKEARLLAFEAGAAAELAYYMDRAAISTLKSQAYAAEEMERKRASYETALMSYHDSWTALLKAVAECDAAIEGSRLALAFSSKTVEDFAHPENEDWSQTYEAFEDGNNWRQLRRKRAALAAQKHAANKIQASRLLIRDTRAELFDASEMLYYWDHRADIQIRRRERAGMGAEEAHSMSVEAQRTLSEALTRTISLMTLRHRSTVKPKRSLLWREYSWKISSAPEARVSKPMLRAWNHLWRTATTVRSPVVAFDAESFAKRFIITIRQDSSLAECGGINGGLSGWTQVVVETGSMKEPPVYINLTSSELIELLQKVDPTLIEPIVHKLRPATASNSVVGNDMYCIGPDAHLVQQSLKL